MNHLIADCDGKCDWVSSVEVAWCRRCGANDDTGTGIDYRYKKWFFKFSRIWRNMYVRAALRRSLGKVSKVLLVGGRCIPAGSS